jgi:hypothetical protein
VGVNNKQRRAAKQRKRAQQRRSGRQEGAPRARPTETRAYDEAPAYDLAHKHVRAFVQARLGQELDDVDLLRQIEAIAHVIEPAPESVLCDVVFGSLVDVFQAVLKGGWSFAELGELVHRVNERWLPVLRAAYDGAHLQSRAAVAEALGLVTLLCDLPLLDEAVAPRPRQAAGAPQVAAGPRPARQGRVDRLRS